MAEAYIQTQATVDLTNCDREPIHEIGAIQPVGFLVAISPDWLITRISANTPDYLGKSIDELLGNSLDGVIAAQATHTIRNRLSVLYGTVAVERVYAVHGR